MKGVILAGGLGSRLQPITHVTNKHLLPVGNKPMIYYPIENLVKSGITDILLVTGGQHAGHFLRVLKNGKELGVKHLEYAYQEGEGGIADALALARDFVGDDHCCVMLGDNIYQYCIKNYVDLFSKLGPRRSRALVLGKCPAGYDATRFGIAVRGPVATRFNVDYGYQPQEIKEKPGIGFLERLIDIEQQYDILTGTYFYTPDVFDICDGLEPSARGELEISDVNRDYARRNSLTVAPVEGYWTDAGTFESLLSASNQVKENGANNDATV